ncbi:MAG: hypothetical protein ACYS9Y_01825 [Planctomycetota bacterium]|jgi:hypothetical protein
MNIKKGFQNLATVLAIGIVLLAISGLAVGILHLVIQIAFFLAVVWLIYKSAIFVMEGFKDEAKGKSQSD